MPFYYKQLDLDNMTAVLLDVAAERMNQHDKWGIQNHGWGVWISILGEEFGEVCQAIQGLLGIQSIKPTDADDLYSELIQLAAVSVQIAEILKKLKGRLKMVKRTDLLLLHNDLQEKKMLLEENSLPLHDLDPKDMPLAIYNYVIEQLQRLMVDEN